MPRTAYYRTAAGDRFCGLQTHEDGLGSLKRLLALPPGRGNAENDCFWTLWEAYRATHGDEVRPDLGPFEVRPYRYNSANESSVSRLLRTYQLAFFSNCECRVR